jgi:hypothetical protein
MDRNNLKALLLIGFFCFLAFIIGFFLSREMAELGLWIMPALSHLYPIAVMLFVIIYSVITSKRILWIRLFLLLGFGLALECFLFWLNKLFLFSSPRLMALFVFSQLVFVYALTLILYFYIISPVSLKRHKKETR